jgi:uncharacterized protein YndB with AHSA1/START domain
MAQDRTIAHSLVIKAPVDEVFTAISAGDGISRWFTTSAVSEPHTGGTFRYVFDNEKPELSSVQEGRYIDVVAGRKLVHPWRFPGLSQPTTVEYALTPRGDETQLDFRNTGFGQGPEWDGPYQRFTGGWKLFLDNLKSVLEGGPDQKGKLFGIKSGAAAR